MLAQNKIPIQPSSNRRLAFSAVIDMLPLVLAVIPWGILTGALAIKIGLSFWQTQAMSLIVYAGAAQLSAMTMLSGGASSLAIMGSVFAVSSRHLLYSIAFRSHVSHLSLPWRLSIGFMLTDEMFAVSQAHTQRHASFSPLYALITGVTFYIGWNVSTFAGIVLGDQISGLDEMGLDFAIVATFIAMTFDRLREKPIVVAVVVSGLLSVLLKPWFSDSYIIIASLLGMSSAYVVESRSGNRVSS